MPTFRIAVVGSSVFICRVLSNLAALVAIHVVAVSTCGRPPKKETRGISFMTAVLDECRLRRLTACDHLFHSSRSPVLLSHLSREIAVSDWRTLSPSQRSTSLRLWSKTSDGTHVNCVLCSVVKAYNIAPQRPI